MPETPEDFGSDRYCYLDGQRYKIGSIRTLRPNPTESNGDFERRMDVMAQQLQQMGVSSVSLAFERRAGAIVQCVLDVVYPPRVSQVDEDHRPAGGRPQSIKRAA